MSIYNPIGKMSDGKWVAEVVFGGVKGWDMSIECTKNIQKVLELSREIIVCADKGDSDRLDDSCGVLFGVARDAAYRIIELAEAERIRHIKKGVWEEEGYTLAD